MEQSSLFNEAIQLLKYAEDKALANTYSYSNMNRTELLGFSKNYKFIVNHLLKSDSLSFKDGTILSWGTGHISPHEKSLIHHLNLDFMPSEGINRGIIRIKDMIFEEVLERTGSHFDYKDGVAYMVIVNGANIEIQKFSGHKVYAEKASPDWTFKNSLPSNPPATSPAKTSSSSVSVPTPTKVAPPRNNTPSYSSSYSYRESLWSRFNDKLEDLNDKIEDLGEWFYYNAYNAGEIGSIILVGGMIIFSVIGVIYIWANEGLGIAILSAFIGYIVCTVFMGVGKFILELCITGIMHIFRYLFYNAWTLLATIFFVAMITTLSVLASGNISSSGNYAEPQEYMAPVTQAYCCTATTVLNIRSDPDESAKIIGTLKSGQHIQVYNIVNGYAKFEYGDSYGYASTKYLKIVE